MCESNRRSLPGTIARVRIYFAASIRGGRSDEHIYRELIDYLSSFGTVLTEHIAHPDDAERGLSDEEIYRRDLEWLHSADVVVAEVTTPSLGVGYELATAEHLGKSTLCLFRPQSGGSLSAMVAGAPGQTVADYVTVEDARRIVRAFLSEHERA